MSLLIVATADVKYCLHSPKIMTLSQSIFTSAKEVMFLPVFVCLSVCVCVCVSKITQKVMDGSF